MGKKRRLKSKHGSAQASGKKIFDAGCSALFALIAQSSHKIFLAFILVVACAIQGYYLYVTSDQPVWWDEAEYLLKARSIALGTPDTGFWNARPIAMPIVLSGFYLVGLGEQEIRIAMALISVVSVYLLYRIGKELFRTEVGLIAALLYALFNMNVFFSMRILTEVPSVTLGLLGLVFYLSGNRRHLWLVCPVLALATLVRFPTFLFFIVVVVHVALTKGPKALRNKDYGLSLILGFATALPYLMWMYIEFGNPLHAVLASAGHLPPSEDWHLRFGILQQYLWDVLNRLPVVLFVILALGALMLTKSLWHPKAARHGWSRDGAGWLLLVIWLIIPTAYFGLMVGAYVPRYILMVYPALILMIAFAIDRGYSLFGQYSRLAAIAFAAIILSVGGYQMLQSTDRSVVSKVGSYESLRSASLWIKQHGVQGDMVVTQSRAQVTYYTAMKTLGIPGTRPEFSALLQQSKPRFVLLTGFERHPDWIRESNVFGQHQMREVGRFPKDRPSVLVLESR